VHLHVVLVKHLDALAIAAEHQNAFVANRQSI